MITQYSSINVVKFLDGGKYGVAAVGLSGGDYFLDLYEFPSTLVWRSSYEFLFTTQCQTEDKIRALEIARAVIKRGVYDIVEEVWKK